MCGPLKTCGHTHGAPAITEETGNPDYIIQLALYARKPLRTDRSIACRSGPSVEVVEHVLGFYVAAMLQNNCRSFFGSHWDHRVLGAIIWREGLKAGRWLGVIPRIIEGEEACPRPSRGDNLEGWSWIATDAIFDLYGHHPRQYRSVDLKDLVQSGYDSAVNALRQMRDKPSAFLRYLKEIYDVEATRRDADAGQEHRTSAMIHKDPIRALFTFADVIIETLLEDLLYWSEMRDTLVELENLDFGELDGSEALSMLDKSKKIRLAFMRLHRMAEHLTRAHESILFTAYRGGFQLKIIAGTCGQKMAAYGKAVKREKVHVCSEHLMDEFEDALYHLCDSDSLRPVGLAFLAFEQMARKYPERTAKLPSILLDELGRYAHLTDVLRTLDSIFPYRLTAYEALPSLRDGIDYTWSHGTRMKRHKAALQLISVDWKDFCRPAKTLEEISPHVVDMARYWSLLEKRLNVKFGKGLLNLYELKRWEKRNPQWNQREGASIVEITTPEFVPIPTSEGVIGQSGHAYRRDNGLLGLIEPAYSIQTYKANKNAKIEETVQHPIFKVNNKQIKVVGKLFGEEEGMNRDIRWDQLVRLFKRIGFRVTGEGGTAFHFRPPHKADHGFLEYKPHPGPSMNKDRVQALEGKLRDLYGWDASWFVRGEEVEFEEETVQVEA